MRRSRGPNRVRGSLINWGSKSRPEGEETKKVRTNPGRFEFFSVPCG